MDVFFGDADTPNDAAWVVSDLGSDNLIVDKQVMAEMRTNRKPCSSRILGVIFVLDSHQETTASLGS